MFKLKHSIAGFALATAASPLVAIAQQTPPTQQQNAQTPPVQTQQDRRDVNQADQQGGLQGQQGNPGQGQGANVTVEQALVMKLKKSNEAEITLAKMAEKKVDDEGFRKFTSQLIEDHQALNKELDQVASMGGRRNVSQPANGQSKNDSEPTNATSPNPSQPGRATTQPAEGAPNQQPGAAQPGAAQPGAQPGVAGRGGEGRQGRGQMGGMGGGRVPQVLTTLMSQACDNNLKMTQEMLESYEGQDFKMAFLGQQIVAHTASLAEMKAIESVGPEQLKAIAQQASPKIQEHLDMAKKLAKKFEDDRDSGDRSKKSEGNRESSDNK